MLSVEEVSSLDTEALCKWLRENSELDLEQTLPIVVDHKVQGVDFLEFDVRTWVAIGVKGGIASYFVRLARKILETEGPVQKIKVNPLIELQNRIPAPSSFAKDRDKGCWVDFLRDYPNRIICHRNTKETPSIPLCLLNPIFAQFIQDLECIEISSQDCIFIGRLTDSMCVAFDSERARMEKFVDLFFDYTQLKLNSVIIDKSTTDGSLTSLNGALFCNLEVRIEKGSGSGDPYMQSIAYYVKSLPKDAEFIQYPCFLLELCGTAFSVSGIVNTDTQVFCEPVSPMYPLLCNQDFMMVGKIAKLFAALRKALISNISTQTNPLQASPFPYVSSFPNGIGVKYKGRIKGLVFQAEAIGREMEVIIKFCSGYNHTIHQFCHSMGFSPTLISTSQLGNYIVIVMEKLDLRMLLREDFETKEVREQIRYILDQLGAQKYVHADMRSCNLMFDTNRNRVVLLDFDWAGIEGVDVYPPFMNPDINWPQGASTGQPLLHAHDCYWWASIIDSDETKS